MAGFDADVTACAQLVERGDPDRFLAVMAAPVAARLVLFPIYAMNVEVSRAPWVTAEPMIAEMRLQWWRDALAEIAGGGTVRRHEVVTPLAGVLSADLAGELDAAVAMRRWDIYRDAFEDAQDFQRYIDATSGSLLWAAVRSLGDADETVVRDAGYAQGLANFLCAVPELEAQGRVPLVDGRVEAVRELAEDGLQRLSRARKSRGSVSQQAAPAMLAVWQAGAMLRHAARDPASVGEGRLARGPRRLALMARAATGLW